jgi:hypothetical protein
MKICVDQGEYTYIYSIFHISLLFYMDLVKI